MNKVFGKKTDFAPIAEDGSRVIISYGFQEVDEENATWFEIYFYKKQTSQVSLADVKSAIIADIDARTDEKILCGFKYEDNDGIERNVWLSAENQRNYSEAQRLADKAGAKNYEPATFKIGEDENGKSCYKTFETLNDLNNFYFAVFAYIKEVLAAGWAEKDTIDFGPYEEFYTTPENSNSAEE